MLRLYLYARVRVFHAQIAHGTAGAACTRSSLRPPILEGKRSKARAHGAARSRSHIQLKARVSAAIPGIVATTRMSRSLSSGAHSRDPLAHAGYDQGGPAQGRAGQNNRASQCVYLKCK